MFDEELSHMEFSAQNKQETAHLYFPHEYFCPFAAPRSLSILPELQSHLRVSSRDATEDSNANLRRLY